MSITKLHASMTKISLAILTAVSSLSLSSCQDEDYGFSAQEIRDAAYDRNFIAKYGEIAPNQSWDLTRLNANGRVQTRAISGVQVTTMSDWYYVDHSIITDFNDLLPEGPAGSNNKSKGTTNFDLTSNGVFYIIPVYQGQSGVGSELWMTVSYDGQTEDYLVWGRGRLVEEMTTIQRQNLGSMDYVNLLNNRTYFSNVDWYEDYNAGKYLASTREAVSTRTKPIKCVIPVGAEIKLYLKITQGHMTYRSHGNDFDGLSARGISKYKEPNLAMTGDILGADKGKMMKLDPRFTMPDNLAQFGSQAMYIACEDAWVPSDNLPIKKYDGPTEDRYGKRGYELYKGFAEDDTSLKLKNVSDDQSSFDYEVTVGPNDWGGDNDMNDLVFLFVSDKLPDAVVANTVEKRYLIEDLGSIVDWDFNDVVLDMVQNTDDDGNVTQTAYLRHLCGTTPFELFVGPYGDFQNSEKLNFQSNRLSYLSTKVEGVDATLIDGEVMDKSVCLSDVSYVIPGNKWNPDENNVWVRVYQNRDYAVRPNDKNDGGDEYGGTVTRPTNDRVINGVVTTWFNTTTFQSFAFPRTGKVPRIIAVDTDHEWTAENVDIEIENWTVCQVNASVLDGVGGTVTGGGTYKAGGSATLMASANDGYRFIHWTDGTIVLSTASTYELSNLENGRTYNCYAVFRDVRDSRTLTGWSATGNATSDIFGYSVSLANNQSLKDALDDGYNTIIVQTNSDKKSGIFGLANSPDVDFVIEGSDALEYKLTDGVGEYVLSPKQIAYLKSGGSLVVRGRTTGCTIDAISMKKTSPIFTINLKPIDKVDGKNVGYVSATGGRSIYSGSPIREKNGYNVFGQASFSAGDVVTLTPTPIEGYRFSHWLQYANGSFTGSPINSIYQESVAISSERSLQAVFAQRMINYNVVNGETIDLQYSVGGSSYATVSSSGTHLEKNGTVKVKITSLNNSTTWYDNDNKLDKCLFDIEFGAEKKENVALNGEVEFTAVNGKDLALKVTVKYLVLPSVNLDGNSRTNTSSGTPSLKVTYNKSDSYSASYYPKGAEVTLTANSGTENSENLYAYAFDHWSSTTDKFKLSRKMTVSTVHYPVAYFFSLPQYAYYYDYKTVDNNEAYEIMAYGENNDKFYNAIKNKNNKRVTLIFNSNVNGNIHFSTANNPNGSSGWTDITIQSVGAATVSVNTNKLVFTLTDSEIETIHSAGGLVVRNETGNQIGINRLYID